LSGSGPSVELSSLKALIASSGLSLVSVLGRGEVDKILLREKPRLESWQKKGFAADLAYMNRQSDIFCDLDGFLEGTRSVITLAVSYYSAREHQPRHGYGRVARYAWGKDYHRVLKKRLKTFTEKLQGLVYGKEELRVRQFSDAVPLLERALFTAGGAGFIGKNTMMIVPGVGSWTFVAELLTNIEIESSHSFSPAVKEGQDCGSCKSCLVACPTAAFEKEFSLNAGKCISYLTIEKKNAFNSWEEQALQDWVFGCDVCQEVCPFNHQGIEETEENGFAPSNGAGPWLDLEKVLSISSKEEFLDLFAGTPLMRSGRDGMIRNAAAVVANQGVSECRPALLKLVDNSGESELVKKSVSSALERLC